MKKKTIILIILLSSKIFGQRNWSLSECIRYAQEKNLYIKQNEYERLIQNKNLEISKNELLPYVSANLNNILSLGQAQDVFGDIRRNDNFNSNSNIGGQIILFNNKKLQKTIHKNQNDFEALNQELESTKIDVSVEILKAYLNILLNKDIAKTNEDSAENAKKLYLKAISTTETGSTPKTVEYEAKANLAKEQQKLQLAYNDIKRTLLELAILLQLDNYEDFDIQNIEIPDNLDNPGLPKFDDWVKMAYSFSPKLKSLDAKIKSSRLQTEIIKTAQSPAITANADIGTFYFNSLTRGNDNAFFKQYSLHFSQQIAVRATIPIFNKGITNLQIEKSKINEDININLLNIEKRKIRQTIQKNYFELKANYENYITSSEVEKNTRLSFEYAEKSYMEGFTTIYDLNISRNNWITSVSNVLQAKYKYLFSLNLLFLYTGQPIQL